MGEGRSGKERSGEAIYKEIGARPLLPETIVPDRGISLHREMDFVYYRGRYLYSQSECSL